MDYLDFRAISQSVAFNFFLNWLNIPYQEKKGELKGEINNMKFIVNTEKNIFFSPQNDSFKGSIINFYSTFKGIDLRQAAKEIKNQFLPDQENLKEIPNLELVYVESLETQFGISEETAIEYEVGLVKQRSIMAGRISFKAYDENDDHIGYFGWHPQRKDWFYPKNFTRPLYNYNRLSSQNVIVTVNPFDCLYLIGLGFSNTVSLVGKTMTARQENLLKRCSLITLFHDEPDNILLRLKRECYLKAPDIIKPLRNHSVEEIGQFLA